MTRSTIDVIAELIAQHNLTRNYESTLVLVGLEEMVWLCDEMDFACPVPGYPHEHKSVLGLRIVPVSVPNYLEVQ